MRRRDLMRDPVTPLEYTDENKEIAVHNELLIDDQEMLWIKRHDSETDTDSFKPLWKIALETLGSNILHLCGTLETKAELEKINNPSSGDVYIVKLDESKRSPYNEFVEYAYVPVDKEKTKFVWECLGANNTNMSLIDIRDDDPTDPLEGYCWINRNKAVGDTDLADCGLIYNNTIVVSYTDLVNVYGLDVTKSYSNLDEAKADESSYYNVILKLIDEGIITGSASDYKIIIPNNVVPGTGWTMGKDYITWPGDIPEEPEYNNTKEEEGCGLLDSDDNIIITWNALVYKYGMDVQKDYTEETALTDPSSPYCVITKLVKEYPDIVTLKVAPTVTSIGAYAFYGLDTIEELVYEDPKYNNTTEEEGCGLLDSDDNVIVTWNALVNKYGMDVQKDYTEETALTDPSSPYCVITRVVEEYPNVVTLKVAPTVTTIGTYAFYGVDTIEELVYEG